MTPYPKGRLFWEKKCKIDVLPKKKIFRQTKCMVIMTKEGSTKIINVMTPRAGVLVRGRGHKSNIVKMHYFL